MIINKKQLRVLFFLLLLLTACNLPGRLTLYDFSSIYDTDRKQPEFNSCFYNYNDDITDCYFELNPNSLFYKTSTDSIPLISKLLIKFEILYSYQNDTVIDSLSIIKFDTLFSNPNKLLQFIIPLNLKKGRNYLVLIKVNDVYAKTYSSKHFFINKTSINSRNNILLKNNSGTLLRNEVCNKDTLKLICSVPNIKFLTVKYYYRNFGLPLPPFSIYEPLSFKYNADSVFIIDIKNGVSEKFILKKEGFYHFQIDTFNIDGFTLFNFYSGYPSITTTEQLILPTRYIMNAKEFEAVQTALNKKEALDRFWLVIGNTPTRAKVLIKKYFNRVVDANNMFTTYIEGWKTDRGMIYIVLGKPNLVNRSDYDETWYYGAKGNFAATRFDFVKVLNPFSSNDYILIRAQMYKDIWYNAVDNWRR